MVVKPCQVPDHHQIADDGDDDNDANGDDREEVDCDDDEDDEGEEVDDDMYLTYILKAKKSAESAFQLQKNLRKKCVNLDIKSLRQKCVNKKRA